MSLDPKKLQQLLSIAEAGSFTKAAAASRISQPALSSGMAVLEKAAGARLLNRGRGGTRLTEYGDLLAAHGRALSVLLARAESDLNLKKQGYEGSLSIGASPVACAELVPGAIARLLQKTPKVQIALSECPDDQLIDGLRTSRFDVVVSPQGVQRDSGEIAQEPVARDTAVVVMRRKHPLVRRKHVTLKELQDVPWVLPDPRTAMWRHIEALFVTQDIPLPVNPVVTNSVLALRALILRSDSVTVASTLLMKHEIAAGQLAAVPLRGPQPSREIVWRARRGPPLSAIAQNFVAALRVEAAALRKQA